LNLDISNKSISDEVFVGMGAPSEVDWRGKAVTGVKD